MSVSKSAFSPRYGILLTSFSRLQILFLFDMSDTNGHYRAPDTTYPLGDKDKDPAVVDEKAAQQGFAHDGLIPPPDSYDPYSAQPAAHRGVGALFRGELGSEVSTPFERKAALINR